MLLFPALLQAEAAAVDMTMVLILGVIALLTLVVLGLKFLRNVFEVLTAPTASLKFHGQNDHFFFSLLVVFLGGLIATTILMLTQPRVVDSFGEYADHVAGEMAAGNSNANYRDVARNMAFETMVDNFDIYVVKNLIAIPMLAIGLWLFIGFLVFLFTKMFHAQVTAVDMLGSTAYGTFFFTIGAALAGSLLIGQLLLGTAGGTAPAPDALGIVGAVLMLYGLLLFFMGVNQASELSVGQSIGVVIVLLVILGGIGYFINYQGAETFAAFRTKVQSYNPATQKV